MRFVVVNMAPYATSVSMLTALAPSLSVVQDAGSGYGDLTAALGGDKDDMYLFLADGTLHHFENEGWDLGSTLERAAFTAAVDALIVTSAAASTAAPSLAPSLSVPPTPLTPPPTESRPPTAAPAPAPTVAPPAPAAPPAPTLDAAAASAPSDAGSGGGGGAVDVTVIVIIAAVGALVLAGTAFFLHTHKKAATTQPDAEKKRCDGAAIEISVVSGDKAEKGVAVQMQA